MKKSIITCLMVLGILQASYSQDHNLTPENKGKPSPIRKSGSVLNNGFWSNWFIAAGAGGQLYFGDHNKQMKFKDRLALNYEGHIGKWFSPAIGTRLGVNGFKVKGLTQNGAYSTGVPYADLPWDGYWLYNQEFNYYNLHADVLFNLSNILGGYKANRIYNLSPYAGIGMLVNTGSPKQHEPSINIGLQNTFQLAKQFALYVDVRGAYVKDRFDGEVGGREGEGPLSASIGFIYKLPKADWDTPVSTSSEYDQKMLLNYQKRIKQLTDDNNELKRLLHEAEHSTITNVKVENKILTAPILVTFPIGKSTVSNEARVNLGFFANLVNQSGNSIIYSIIGYADVATGTDAINQRLSKERATAIFNVLVNEFKVSPSRLKIVTRGGTATMFYDDPRLNRAVITLAE
ncbi:OmpA family protein [Sphingobacterium sp. Mn56C]|uniref:OmpA family protein n=1 Tax=Sphingobacterium sp. Mn56C TaxID=3395261 RepID=UPI003BE9B5DA